MPIPRRALARHAALAAVLAAAPSTTTVAAAAEAAPREIPIAVAGAYTPARIEVAPGEPVVLVFTRAAAGGCDDAVVFAATGIRRELPVGQPVRVSLTAAPGQRIAFACPMGHVTGEVVAAGSTTSATAASSSASAAAAAPAPDGAIAITVDASGFHPDRIEVPVGAPTRLRFTRAEKAGCNTGVRIPGLGVDEARDLPAGVPVEIVVTPARAGEYRFACPMDMAGGTIVARDAAAGGKAPHAP